MIKCKVCGRVFKSPQALGGHVSRAHLDGDAGSPGPPEEMAPVPREPRGSVVREQVAETAAPALWRPEQQLDAAETGQAPELADTDAAGADAAETGEGAERQGEAPQRPDEEPSQSRQIQGYLKLGYTFAQLTGQLGFKESTVRQEIAKLVPPEGEKMPVGEGPGDGIPVTRKAGAGTEVLNPEAVLRRYTDGSIEDEIELRGMMKLRAAMLMVMDLVNIQKEASEADAKRIRPVLELMKEAREEQDAAAQRARDSNLEIADRAADETARQVYELLSRDNARVTGTLDQIRQQIGGGSDDPFSRLLGMMQSMQQLTQMFGMPMGMVGMPGGGVAGGPAQQPWQPPPIEYEDVPEGNLEEEQDV